MLNHRNRDITSIYIECRGVEVEVVEHIGGIADNRGVLLVATTRIEIHRRLRELRRVDSTPTLNIALRLDIETLNLFNKGLLIAIDIERVFVISEAVVCLKVVEEHQTADILHRCRGVLQAHGTNLRFLDIANIDTPLLIGEGELKNWLCTDVGRGVEVDIEGRVVRELDIIVRGNLIDLEALFYGSIAMKITDIETQAHRVEDWAVAPATILMEAHTEEHLRHKACATHTKGIAMLCAKVGKIEV